MAGMNRVWRLRKRPTGRLKESDFTFAEEPIPPPAEGQIRVRNVYLSIDPTYRLWANEAATYMPPVGIGEVMRGATVGVVEESRDAGFAPGDIVTGLLGWQDYSIASGSAVSKIPPGLPIPLTAYLGVLGGNGLAAYFGLLDIGQPRPGETLVVSAAAGAVGSLVGQIGKIKGCRVVGIAGTEEKCHWIADEIGFDAAINYRKESLPQALRHRCPEGVDIYFDNVGGRILDAVLGCLNLHARVVLCGMISQYNDSEPVTRLANFHQVLFKRVRMEGFIVLDYLDRVMQAMTDLGTWLLEGKIRYRVDVVEGLESAPAALNQLFEGSNRGKLIVRISQEPPA